MELKNNKAFIETYKWYHLYYCPKDLNDVDRGELYFRQFIENFPRIAGSSAVTQGCNDRFEEASNFFQKSRSYLKNVEDGIADSIPDSSFIHFVKVFSMVSKPEDDSEYASDYKEMERVYNDKRYWGTLKKEFLKSMPSKRQQTLGKLPDVPEGVGDEVVLAHMQFDYDNQELILNRYKSKNPHKPFNEKIEKQLGDLMNILCVLWYENLLRKSL